MSSIEENHKLKKYTMKDLILYKKCIFCDSSNSINRHFNFIKQNQRNPIIHKLNYDLIYPRIIFDNIGKMNYKTKRIGSFNISTHKIDHLQIFADESIELHIKCSICDSTVFSKLEIENNFILPISFNEQRILINDGDFFISSLFLGKKDTTNILIKSKNIQVTIPFYDFFDIFNNNKNNVLSTINIFILYS